MKQTLEEKVEHFLNEINQKYRKVEKDKPVFFMTDEEFNEWAKRFE